MFHDLIILVVLSVVAYVSALMCYTTFRQYRFKNKKEWWKEEGIILSVLIFAVLLILALEGKFFHSVR